MSLNYQKIINQMKKEKPIESSMRVVKFTKHRLLSQNLMGQEMRSSLVLTECFQVDYQSHDRLVTSRLNFRNTEVTLES